MKQKLFNGELKKGMLVFLYDRENVILGDAIVENDDNAEIITRFNNGKYSGNLWTVCRKRNGYWGGNGDVGELYINTTSWRERLE